MFLKDIVFTPNNARTDAQDSSIEELSEVIKQKGLISPILLREIKGKGKFEVIAGQRRYLALKGIRGDEGELDASEYMVKEGAGVEDLDILEISIMENQYRKALSPMDLNRAILKLNKNGHKDSEIAKVLNISKARLKRLANLGQDKNKMLPEIREELSKSGDDVIFTDAHWDKMRNIEDQEVIKDVFEQIMSKQLPAGDVPGIINAVQKANDAYDSEQGKGTDSSSAKAPEDDQNGEGPIRYKHKGELQMVEEDGERVFKVIGSGEDERFPLDHYMEYLKHSDKFKCKIDLKITFIPIE